MTGLPGPRRWYTAPRIRFTVLSTLLLAGVLSTGEGTRIYLKAILAQLLLETAWSQTLAGHARARPWPWADTWPVARLRAPVQRENLIVLSGASGSTLAFGPAHMLASAVPGSDDNVVLAGHRDTHFAFLEHLQIGEVLELDSADGKRHRYRVTDRAIVHQTQTSVMARTGLKSLTLITCWPFDAIVPGGPMRYVVRAVADASL